jgi:hypothetical protein
MFGLNIKGKLLGGQAVGYGRGKREGESMIEIQCVYV